MDGFDDKVKAVGFWRCVPIKDLEPMLEGKDVNMPYINGYSILHWAAANHQESLVTKLLLDKGADVNAQDANNNRTPLHVAILYNTNFWGVIIELISNNQIDPNIRDNDGRTALHLLAIKNEQWDMSAFLESITLLVRDERIDCTIQDNDGKTAFDYAEENEIFDYAEYIFPNGEHGILTEWRSKSRAPLTTNN